MAYFLGHFSHRTASYLTNARPAWFDDKSQRLIGSLYYHVRKLLSDMHSIEFKNGERIRSLETYLLADSYIVASGNTAERDSMLAREGFHKTSMVAFGIDALVVFVTLFAGGTRLQLAAGSYYSLNFACSLLLFLALVVMTLVFWRGYTFFNRLKINNTLLLAMTLRTLDKERLDKHE